MDIKKIILVYKTHFDIGFTDLAERVIAGYAEDMLREVIATCKGTQHLGALEYVWTMPAWPLWHMVNNCPADLKEELDDLIGRGQVVWHALPFTSHTDCCSQMEYIEGLRYAKELSDRYQKPYPISGKMTDVPGHSIMLPDILEQAGIRFLHLGCNEFATPPQVPDLFFWETFGGRRVLTMYSKGGYGTGLVPPAGWQFPVWMALMHTHDNSGPQSAEAIERLSRQLREMYPDAEIVSGTMDDFYYELARCGLEEVPVVRKDLADTWIHGIGSYPKEVALMRENRRKMEYLQALYGKRLLEGWQGEKEAEKLLNTYYEEVCLFEEHTWGADVKSWLGSKRVYEKESFLQKKGAKSYRFMEKSWEEQRKRARRANACCVELERLLEGGKAFQGDNCSRGLNCSLQISGAGNKLRVENHRYELTFSESTGQILFLKDKESGEILMKARGEEGIFSYRYDKYGYDDINEYLRNYGYHFTAWGILDYGREDYPFCEHETFYPSFVGYETEENRISFFYETLESADKYGDAQRIRVTVSFPEEGNDLYVELNLSGKQESPYVEAGSFVLPLAEEETRFYVQKGGTILDPERDLAEGANHSLYCLENGMLAFNEKRTLCIRTRDAPLAAMGDPGIYVYRPRYTKPEYPNVYINLFNNMWGTNFPQWIGGDMTFRFKIACLERRAADRKKEWMEVLAGQEEVKNCGKESLSDAETVKLPEGMKLIGARKYQKGFCLYFSEIWGKSGSRSFSAKGWRISSQDLFGRFGEVQKDEIRFEAAAYGVQRFYLEKEAGNRSREQEE